MAERQLVIVRHYEPPDDMAGLLRRVHDRLLDTSTLERLTGNLGADTITPEYCQAVDGDHRGQ